MTLSASDLIWRPSSLVSDSTPAQNGGRMNSALALASGIKNNLFPDASLSERSAGSVKLRKAFIHAAPAVNSPLIGPKVFLDQFPSTDGPDFMVLYQGSATDTANAKSGTRPYGICQKSGYIELSGGVYTISCVLEPGAFAWYAANQPFRSGDLIRIADFWPVSTYQNGGNEDFLTVLAANYNEGLHSLTLTTTTAFNYNLYNYGSPLISSVLAFDDLQAGSPVPTVTSAGGSWVGGTTVGESMKGSIHQTWTGTFTSATAFSLSGDTVGQVGSGTTAADTVATNPNANAPYFTLPAAGFSGTFQAGDTFSFNTGQAALPIWLERHIPAGCGSLSGDTCSVGVSGETG